jgi:protein-disulfide isomerase
LIIPYSEYMLQWAVLTSLILKNMHEETIKKEEASSNLENNPANKGQNNQNAIAGAIILAGIIIAGAILLKGGGSIFPAKQATVFNQCLDNGKYSQAVAASTNSAQTAGVNSTPTIFILKDGKVADTINGALPVNQIQTRLDNALAGKDKAVANTKLPPATSADFMQGNSQSGVTLVEYADFQCPFCGKFFNESEQTVIANYIKQGKINFVYRDFTFLGPESVEAAQAARCAADQGKFWQYHDYLFSHQMGENQGAFATPNLKTFAVTLGLK